MVCYNMTIFLADIQPFENLRVQKNNLNIEKIIFKVVQIKFLAMHITNQKVCFVIFMVGNLLISSWNMILMIFGINNVLSDISTNIAVLLMTALVLQAHIFNII